MGIRFHKASVRQFVADMIGEELSRIDRFEAFLPPADPFGLAHDCLNPEGHDPISSCGEVVCCHCGKIFR